MSAPTALVALVCEVLFASFAVAPRGDVPPKWGKKVTKSGMVSYSKCYIAHTPLIAQEPVSTKKFTVGDYVIVIPSYREGVTFGSGPYNSDMYLWRQLTRVVFWKGEFIDINSHGTVKVIKLCGNPKGALEAGHLQSRLPSDVFDGNHDFDMLVKEYRKRLPQNFAYFQPRAIGFDGCGGGGVNVIPRDLKGRICVGLRDHSVCFPLDFRHGFLGPGFYNSVFGHVQLKVENHAGNDTDSRRKVNSDDASKVQPKLPFLKPMRKFLDFSMKAIGAFCLSIGGIVALFYSLKRTDYLLVLGIYAGFVMFLAGVFIMLFSIGRLV